MNRDADIAIVGGGIVGAALAALIAEAPSLAYKKIVLIDNQDAQSITLSDDFEPRVVALSERSCQIFEAAGVWSAMKAARHCPYNAMHVWDAEGTGQVHFSSDDIQLPQLGYIFENKAVLQALQSRLDHSNIDIIFNASVESVLTRNGKTELTLSSGEHIDAELVVAADGGDSSLRRMLSVPVKEWDYGQTAIVATVETENSHEFCAWQRFSESGPLAFLPLSMTGSDSQSCSIVWSLDRAEAEKMLSFDDDAFAAQLTREFESKLGQVKRVSKRYSFPLHQRHALDYFSNSVVLVGDAAHTIHPLAGQGVNIGLYDIEVLFQEILIAEARGYELANASLMRRYQRQRQSHNMMATAAMESFKRLFGSSNIALRYLRNTGLHFVNQQAVLKKQFSMLAAGLES